MYILNATVLFQIIINPPLYHSNNISQTDLSVSSPSFSRLPKSLSQVPVWPYLPIKEEFFNGLSSACPSNLDIQNLSWYNPCLLLQCLFLLSSSALSAFAQANYLIAQAVHTHSCLQATVHASFLSEVNTPIALLISTNLSGLSSQHLLEKVFHDPKPWLGS